MQISRKIKIRGPRPAGLAIERDDHGVPHIQAATLDDANWGLGYAHACDRATQLMMMRIIGQGRLCELLQDRDDNLAIDRFFRRANWARDDASQLKVLTPETQRWCQAYCDGINAGIATKRFSELSLLGYQPEPWKIVDTLLLLRMSGYLTLAQSQGEVERLYIELAQAGVSAKKLAALFPVSEAEAKWSALKDITLGERFIPQDLLWQNPIPRTMASNNWVISGERSASGQAMMANDPHLETNRLPNVWYEVAISAGNYQGLGMGMPGIPGILVGRTPAIAWGVTYTFMDTVDSWIEDCRNGKYRRGKSWQRFSVRKETIKRKSHSDETVTFYENRHGVLDGDPFEPAYYLATKWSPDRFGAATLNSCYALSKCSDVEQTMAYLGQIESAWNWVIVDQAGNIGYQMSGLCPRRNKNWNGFTPAPGWDPDYDWQGFEKPEDLPRCFNPKSGFIVTANQDLNALGKCRPINMPMGDYRARRITALLEKQNKHGVNSFGQIQMDTYSLQAEMFLEVLLPILDQHGRMSSKQARLLDNWDRCYKSDSTGASFFEDFYGALRKIVFGGSEIPEAVIHHLNENTALFIDFYQNFDQCLLKADSPWYAHITQEAAFLQAFDTASADFKFQAWGERNQITFVNQLYQGKLPKFLGFDSAPVSLIGGRATPHQGQVYQSAGRTTSFAPSIRIAADMADDKLYTSLAGGPSDNRFSRWYQSGTADWLAGKFRILHN